MQTACTCRHLTDQDLYRTILLEEGCDLAAPRRLRPEPVSLRPALTVYAAEAARWVPRLRVLVGGTLTG